MEEKEFSNVYAIPANYTDSGKLLGGMVETRNAIVGERKALCRAIRNTKADQRGTRLARRIQDFL